MTFPCQKDLSVRLQLSQSHLTPVLHHLFAARSFNYLHTNQRSTYQRYMSQYQECIPQMFYRTFARRPVGRVLRLVISKRTFFIYHLIFNLIV